MLFKSSILTLLFFTITFVMTLANAASGFYVGGGLGPEIANFRVTSHIKVTGVSNIKDDNQLSGTGGFASLFLGYGKPLSEWGLKTNQFYLGGELNANASSLSHQNSNDEFFHRTFSTTTYRMRYSYGASILPGYLYTDNLLFYGRVGYSSANFTISTSDASLADINRNLNGIQWGLGVQPSLNKQLAMRMDYTYIVYQSTSISTRPSSFVRKNTQFTPYVNQIEFALIYYFEKNTTT